ncbi:MAG: GMC family oxidoreductase [Candidatus Omnitrophota bacterium]
MIRVSHKIEETVCDSLVIGSGPAGATTAYLLAQAGRDVVLAEEGPSVPVNSLKAYSWEEMAVKYRHAGMTVAWGKPKIVYLEGRCIGGASEINAALYHYPLAKTLRRWQNDYHIENFSFDDLQKFFEETEKDITIDRMPQGVGPASHKILQGAASLKWKAGEVSRCWKYVQRPDGSYQETRQTIAQTLIPLAISLGCRVCPDTKVILLNLKRQHACSALVSCLTDNGTRRLKKIHFRHVFVRAGAVQTPWLLQRSGIRHHVGHTLRMHPAMRVAALFPDPVNDEREGVPVVQVEEFKPQLTLGGSFSSLPHLALWMAGKKETLAYLAVKERLAIFYALIISDGVGSVRNIPLLNEPSVSLPLTAQDRRALGEGVGRLGRLLFAAGAEKIFFPIDNFPVCSQEKDLRLLEQGLSKQGIDVSTIHLFCSCPMGEVKNFCAVDSFGKLHDFENIYLNDASILPEPPGVNPQALIMALARRNTQRFLSG